MVEGGLCRALGVLHMEDKEGLSNRSECVCLNAGISFPPLSPALRAWVG